MSEFFDSEIVQDELNTINDMQNEIYSDLTKFPTLSHADKKAHIQKLTVLLEKQRLMYTRLSLSDDPKAIELKQQLQQSVQVMGFSPTTDIQALFSDMAKTIKNLENHVE
jgi:hypothetical protein